MKLEVRCLETSITDANMQHFRHILAEFPGAVPVELHPHLERGHYHVQLPITVSMNALLTEVLRDQLGWIGEYQP